MCFFVPYVSIQRLNKPCDTGNSQFVIQSPLFVKSIFISCSYCKDFDYHGYLNEDAKERYSTCIASSYLFIYIVNFDLVVASLLPYFLPFFNVFNCIISQDNIINLRIHGSDIMKLRKRIILIR